MADEDEISVAGGVVVGYDGSAESSTALRWALTEARLRGAALHVVRAWQITSALAAVEHSYGSVPSAAELAAALEEATRRDVAALDTAGVDVEVHVVHGATSPTLLAAARSADLLVVGSRGRGGFAGLRIGSSAEQLVANAPCTVVVVRPGRGEGDPTTGQAAV